MGVRSTLPFWLEQLSNSGAVNTADRDSGRQAGRASSQVGTRCCENGTALGSYIQPSESQEPRVPSSLEERPRTSLSAGLCVQHLLF